MRGSSESMEMMLKHTCERVWRARKAILIYQVFVILAVLFVILFWPRTYASTAKMFLQRGRESVGLDPTANATGNSIAINQAGRDSEIKTAMDILLSRGLIEPVVDELTPDVVLGRGGVGEGKSSVAANAISDTVGWLISQVQSIDPSSDRERAVIKIEKNLDIDSERKSEVISVAYEADTPELAQLVVGAIVDEYHKKHSSLHRTTGSAEFFDEQSQRLRLQIEVASNALRQAKDDLGFASIEGQQLLLETQLSSIRHDALGSEKLLFGARAKMENIMRQMADLPRRRESAEVLKPNEGADMQRELLYGLQIEEMGAVAAYTDKHPMSRKLRRQVTAAEEELRKQKENRTESTNEINPIFEHLTMAAADIEAEIAGLEARQAKLAKQEVALLAEIKQLNQASVTIAQLQRDVNVAEKKYIRYAENLEEARIDQAMQAGRITSVSIAQSATLQEKPVSPSKLLTVLLGGFLSIAGFLAIGYAAVMLDDTVTSEYEARKRLELPIWGVIPQSRHYARVHV